METARVAMHCSYCCMSSCVTRPAAMSEENPSASSTTELVTKLEMASAVARVADRVWT
jgi:hypothetical protein